MGIPGHLGWGPLCGWRARSQNPLIVSEKLHPSLDGQDGTQERLCLRKVVHGNGVWLLRQAEIRSGTQPHSISSSGTELEGPGASSVRLVASPVSPMRGKKLVCKRCSSAPSHTKGSDARVVVVGGDRLFYTPSAFLFGSAGSQAQQCPPHLGM